MSEWRPIAVSSLDRPRLRWLCIERVVVAGEEEMPS